MSFISSYDLLLTCTQTRYDSHVKRITDKQSAIRLELCTLQSKQLTDAATTYQLALAELSRKRILHVDDNEDKDSYARMYPLFKRFLSNVNHDHKCIRKRLISKHMRQLSGMTYVHECQLNDINVAHTKGISSITLTTPVPYKCTDELFERVLACLNKYGPDDYEEINPHECWGERESCGDHCDVCLTPNWDIQMDH